MHHKTQLHSEQQAVLPCWRSAVCFGEAVSVTRINKLSMFNDEQRISSYCTAIKSKEHAEKNNSAANRLRATLWTVGRAFRRKHTWRCERFHDVQVASFAGEVQRSPAAVRLQVTVDALLEQVVDYSLVAAIARDHQARVVESIGNVRVGTVLHEVPGETKARQADLGAGGSSVLCCVTRYEYSSETNSWTFRRLALLSLCACLGKSVVGELRAALAGNNPFVYRSIDRRFRFLVRGDKKVGTWKHFLMANLTLFKVNWGVREEHRVRCTNCDIWCRSDRRKVS